MIAAGEGVVVVAKRVGEELRALKALVDRLFIALEAGEHRKDGERRIESLAHRVALLADEPVVLIDALLELFGRLESEAERAHAEAGRNHRRLAT